MAQYSQRTQPMHRPGQSEHSHGGGALAYGGKPAGGGVVAVPQPRGTPAAPYAPQYSPQLRLHQPGYGSAALSYRDGGYVRGGGGGTASEFRGGARVSLLAPYIPAPAQHPPPADPPPFKKIRFGVDRPPNTSLPLHQPLRVDTREPVNAYSTVELSPNPPSEPTVEDQSFRTTKDDLLQQISKVDREMALSEATLTKLKNKQKELEQSASKPERAEEPEEAPPRHRSLAQCVYAENRKKAASAHAVLAHLGPPVLYPLYNQPQDTEVYHENIRKHRLFRKHLAEHIRRLKQEAEMREDLLAEAYSRRAAEWMRRVERIEQGQKRKAKDARNREFFEKVFPELRKQREERERFNRLGARVKSEAELEEIADGLHEQEHEDKKMRSLTVVPPLLRDPRDRRPVYIDTNRRCMDMESEHKELQLRNTWSRAERELFREKYLQHPKNFGQIASFLPRKSVRDCVRFYYLSKKAENYKQLLRKPRQRRSARNPPRPAPEPELAAGVTTRLQRSQGAGTSSRQSDKEASAEDGSAGAVCPLAQPATPARSELIRTPPLPPSPPPASSAPLAPVTTTCSSSAPAASSPAPAPAPASPLAIPVPLPMEDTPLPPATTPADVTVVTAVTTVAVTTTPTTSVASTPTPTTSIVTTSATSVSTATSVAPPAAAVTSLAALSSGSAPPTPQPAQPPTPTQPPPTPEAAVTERVGTPSSTAPTPVTTVSATCAVCNMPGATRTVSRSRAVHYGLKEEAVGSRVCEPCHCRCVRSRYTRCPVPTCPGPRVRAKRLRHLPPKWHDLALDAKRPLMEDFQIPSELSKCCLACFKRITRRLESSVGEPEPEPSEEEVSRVRQLLREHGPAWDRLAPLCSRSPASLKAFYFTYRKKYQLDAVVDRTNITTGRSSSDESATSSGDTDTCSAGSPRPPGPPGPRTDAVAPRRLARLNPHQPRDEYDSSATETADEESEPSAKVLPPTCIPTPVSSAPTPPTTVLAPVTAATPPCPAGTPTTSSATVVTSSASLLPRNGPASGQLSVRDVVLNMIEISLTKNSQPVPPAVKPQQLKVTPTTGGRETLATLSVVNSSHSRASPRSPHRPATITPLAAPPKDGVVVLHIEPRAEPLLDLSVKRVRHELAFPQPQQHQKPAYRNCGEYSAYRATGPVGPAGAGAGAGATGAPAPQPERKHAQPSPAPGTKGSITLGTPVPLESRYEPRRTPEPKPGSITLGTPVPHPAQHDKRFDQYYKRRSPHASYYTTRPHEPNNFSPQQNAAYSRSPYGLEQRQIIMADFITSQQMHGGGRRPERPERSERPERPERPERTERPDQRSGSPQYSPQPRREREPVSVIQRHTPHVYPQQHPHPPPGHEAFASLVNVASAATALPVPRDHDHGKDGKLHAHHAHHDIRLQREMTMAKYQQIHYQVLERDRRAQAQYLERDRIAMQQNRERERAMLQERQIAMEHQQHQQQQHQQQQHQQQQQQQQHQQQQQQQHQSQSHHQQQMMMERQHPQQHQVVSSAEADRRLLGVSVSVAGSNSAYTPHKHRAITPHHLERKDNRPATSAPSAVSAVSAAAAAGPAGASAEARARAAEGKLTAASLIDAIITHQISQTTDTQQRFPTLRECENSNQQQQQQERQERPPSERVERERDELTPVSGHTTSIKLGDLASNIITRDFCSPTTTLMHHNRFVAPTSEGYSVAGEEWKRRDAPKHAPFLEPVSPPDTHQPNRSNTARRYGASSGAAGVAGVGGVGGAGAGGVLTAFDYVTNRIVEVMRSDADERAKPLAFPPAAYAYPYSALNVATATPPTPNDAPPAPAPAPAPPPVEPAPLMSAQYEPLSDED